MQRMAVNSPPAANELLGEMAHIEHQIERLKQDPEFVVLSPLESKDHQACELEAEALRVQNLQLRAMKDTLWAKNAELRAEIRTLSPRHRPLGRPPRGARVAQLAAEAESLLGLPVYRLNPWQVALGQPVLEKLMALAKTGAYHKFVAASLTASGLPPAA
jgi:hypothetical protein